MFLTGQQKQSNILAQQKNIMLIALMFTSIIGILAYGILSIKEI